MSSDTSMKYVSSGLHDLYRILQFQEKWLWKSDLFGALLACDLNSEGE